MTVILCGGGIDTVLSMHYADQWNNNIPIYFDLGHNYMETEKKHLLNLIPNIIIDSSLKGLGTLEDINHYIPNRNIFLILAAFRYSPRVFIGSTVDDVVNDQNRKAFDKFEELAKELGIKNAEIITPFLNANKGKIEVMLEYKDHPGLKDKFLKSFSCFRPINNLECMGCAACFRKNVVLSYVYNVVRPFTNTVMLKQYVEKAKALKTYSATRSLAIVEYADKVNGVK